MKLKFDFPRVRKAVAGVKLVASGRLDLGVPTSGVYFSAILLLSVLLLASGCSLDQMATSSRLRPFSESPVFADRSSARLPIPGTVARGQLDNDDLLYRGEVDGKVVDEFPFPITSEALLRGRARFNIHCSPCHGQTGLGNGMVVQRGFPAPPSYFSERLRNASAGHLFQVVTNGFGAMPSYSDQVEVHDRWKIIAYLRALQLSRAVKISEISQSERKVLESEGSHP